MLAGVAAKRCHAPNFAEKTFVNSYKTSKFTKAFSLESFLLYGIQTKGAAQCVYY